MPTIVDLPLELLTIIFQNLCDLYNRGDRQRAISQCALVSKALLPVARARLFERFHLSSFRDPILRAPHLQQHVRRLTVDLDLDLEPGFPNDPDFAEFRYEEPWPGFFPTSFGYFKNITTLSMRDMSDWHCLPSSLKTSLIQVLSSSKLNRLFMEGCCFDADLDDLKEILTVCGDNLQELVIEDSGLDAWMGSGGGDDDDDDDSTEVRAPVILSRLKILELCTVERRFYTTPFIISPRLREFSADISWLEAKSYHLPPYLPQGLQDLSIENIQWDTVVPPVDIRPSSLSITVIRTESTIGETFHWLVDFILGLPQPNSLDTIIANIRETHDSHERGELHLVHFQRLSGVLRNLRHHGRLKHFELHFVPRPGGGYLDDLEEIEDGFSEEIEEGLLSFHLDRPWLPKLR
ncbi:hypothetical protein ONZ45_g2352 [Pleurotus djamor]|nr:hypothetical protein ONZ45_g2352 [Pleurotus djamor]